MNIAPLLDGPLHVLDAVKLAYIVRLQMKKFGKFRHAVFQVLEM
jgi:hypothetical protein